MRKIDGVSTPRKQRGITHPLEDTGRTSLLDGMHQFVGQQMFPGGSCRSVFPFPEHHILAYHISYRIDCLC